MRRVSDDLPRDLKIINDTEVLEFVRKNNEFVQTFPIRSNKVIPVFQDPVEEISRIPVNPNFQRIELDMDIEEDEEEYKKIMNYIYGNFGAKVIDLQRKFIKKKKNNKTKVVERIYIEYIAPYRELKQ